MVWGLSLQTSAPFSPHPSQAFPPVTLLHVWFPLDLRLRDCELPKCITQWHVTSFYWCFIFWVLVTLSCFFVCLVVFVETEYLKQILRQFWILIFSSPEGYCYNFIYLPLCSGISLGMIYDIFLLLGLWLLMSLISVFVCLGFFVLFFNILVFVFSLASLKSLLCLHWSDISWIEVVLNHLKPVSLLFSADKCIYLWAGSVQSLCHFQVCSGFHSLLGPFGFPVHTCWASGSARHM